MSFAQIVSFHLDDASALESLAALERRWVQESQGRRTVVDGALYRDRTDPTHYVAFTCFASAADAAVNSALPETDAFAAGAAELTSGPVTYTDLDLVRAVDVRTHAAAGLRSLLETNEVPPGLLAEDVVTHLFVPNWAVVVRGRDALLAGLVDEAPSRTIEQWEVHPTGEGFVVEYAYRNHARGDQPATLSIGTVVARLRAGRIADLRTHCAGNWSAELERQVADADSAAVPA